MVLSSVCLANGQGSKWFSAQVATTVYFFPRVNGACVLFYIPPQQTECLGLFSEPGTERSTSTNQPSSFPSRPFLLPSSSGGSIFLCPVGLYQPACPPHPISVAYVDCNMDHNRLLEPLRARCCLLLAGGARAVTAVATAFAPAIRTFNTTPINYECYVNSSNPLFSIPFLLWFP